MTTAARFPFVSRDEIVLAYRPGAEVSEAAFRTLRRRRCVSAGISIRPRRGARVAGQLRAYAAINIDAAVLARRGHHAEAEEVAAEATRFETEWEPVVAELAAQLDVTTFAALRELRNQVAHALVPAALELGRFQAQIHASLGSAFQDQLVRVAALTEHWTALDTIASQLGEFAEATRAIESVHSSLAQSLSEFSQYLLVDPSLTRAAALEVGDLAVLRIERNEGTSLVSLSPAIEDEDEPFELSDEFAPYFSDAPLPRSVRADVERRRRAGETIAIPRTRIPLAS